MARINPLTGLPEEETGLVDPNAVAAAPPVLPTGGIGAAPVTEMAGGGGAFTAAAGKAADLAAARAPSGPVPEPQQPMIQIGGPKVDSTTTTSATTREIVAPKVQAAAEKVEKQAQAASDAATNVQIAEAQANEAQTQFLQATKDAAKTEAQAKADSARAIVQGRAEAAAEMQRREAEAAEKVKVAQDAEDRAHAATGRTFWNDKPWFYEALAGIAVAASRRNLRAMGEDPNKSGVAQTITGLLEQDKAKKMHTYLRSKEFLADAKKLPGQAREAYNLRLADLEAGQAAQLKLAAAEAEKLKATADADPEYVATQQQVLLAKSQELGAAAQLKYGQQGAAAAQMANPNEKRSSSTTRVDVDETAQQAKPKPAPGASEVQDMSSIKATREKLQQLRQDILTSGEGAADFNEAQGALRKFTSSAARAKTQEKLHIVGPVASLAEQFVGTQRPSADLFVDQEKHPKAIRILQGFEDLKTGIAKSYGPNVAEGDRAAAAASTALQSMKPSETIDFIDKQLKQLDEKERLLNETRNFGAP